MNNYVNFKTQRGKVSVVYRFISLMLIWSLSFTQIVPNSYAQSISPLNLPIPGTMVTMSEVFVPVLLKGMTINPKDPFHIDFIVDSGNTQFAADDIKTESDRLVKYFMASMTVPKNDLWVNLSPYEKDRIIPEELGKTELGRDLLAQDYILKQLSSSLMYPDSELGAKFWEKVYSQAREKYGITEIPLNTFNKVWILPESATVYEHGNSVYITESHLKVMLDQDYLASQKSQDKAETNQNNKDDSSTITSQIIRELIIPEIEKEVNTGKNFAPLRQIYHSLILAKWYKETVRQSILSQVYIDQNKVSGLEFNDAATKEKIYEQYLEAYKKGVYNYMKEEYDQLSQTVIPRQYFSGGFVDAAMAINRTDAGEVGDGKVGDEFVVGVDVQAKGNGVTRRFFLKAAAVATAGALIGGTPQVSLADEVDIMLAKLGSSYSPDKATAIKTLGQIGDKRAVVPLFQLLSEEDPHIVSLVIIALGQIGDKRAIYHLKRALSHESEEVRESAEQALQKLGVSLPNIIVRKAWHNYPVIRVLGIGTSLAAIYLFWRKYTVSDNWRRFNNPPTPMAKDRSYGGYVGEFLYGEDAERAYGPSPNPEYDIDSKIQVEAIQALERTGSVKAVDVLIAQISDSNLSLRRYILKSLVKINDPRVERIKSILKSLNERIPQGESYSKEEKAIELLPFALKLEEEGYDFEIQYIKEKGYIGPIQVGERPMTILREESGQVFYPSSEPFSTVPGTYGEAVDSQGVVHEFSFSMYDEKRYPTEPIFEDKWIVDSPERVEIKQGKKINRDRAMLIGDGIILNRESQNKIQNGGIDMNNIEMKKSGSGQRIQFDPMDMDSLINENIQGFVPVIINVTPVNSILPILGLEPTKQKEEYKVSQLN